jgi:putative transposase
LHHRLLGWKIDKFQKEYNVERPHKAPDDEPPASLWVPSPRPYPERLAPPEYPGHFEVRRVSNAGEFIINHCHRLLSQALKRDYIGLEAVDGDVWNILCYTTLLGRLDEHTGRVTGASYRSDECK